MRRSLLPFSLSLVLMLFAAVSSVQAAGEEAVLTELSNPGYQAKPSWFKHSFLDIGEDVAEAAAEDKRLILYFYQDGCPYCEKLLRENFADREITATAQDRFDVVAINIWGDREVTDLEGERTTEKGFATALGVQYTPTMLLFDEQGQTVLRIDGYFPPHQFHQGLRYVALKREQAGETFPAFYRRQQPSAASGQLHQEPGFMSEPLRLADNRARSDRPLLLFFEQPVCAACDELHEDILQRDAVAGSLAGFDAAVVNAFSTDPIQTPDGRELPTRDWSTELGIIYTPSLLFFDADGNEVFRTEAYLKAFHIKGAIDYAASGAYREEPSFQRYLQGRTAELQAEGIEIDMME